MQTLIRAGSFPISATQQIPRIEAEPITGMGDGARGTGWKTYRTIRHPIGQRNAPSQALQTNLTVASNFVTQVRDSDDFVDSVDLPPPPRGISKFRIYSVSAE
jgi:hypothetical protein